jgi:quercetin dioxygenase-like cupin family protein
MVTPATLSELILGPPVAPAAGPSTPTLPSMSPCAPTDEAAGAGTDASAGRAEVGGMVDVAGPIESVGRNGAAGREPLPPSLIGDIAAGVAQVPESWQHLVHHDPDGRRPVRLMATDAYEVWVIGWLEGQNVRPHDHGGSAAAVLVTEGALTEVTLLGNERTLVPGQVHRLGPGVVHDVVNTSDVPATSIHVYSPPLSTMTYYDPVSWEPEETVRVESEEPVLSDRNTSRVLHPAARARQSERSDRTDRADRVESPEVRAS